jgi:hypothetical protein
MRPCHESSIPEDHRPRSEHHTGRLEVEDRLYERLRRQPNDLSELGREQSLCIATHCCDYLGSNLCRGYRQLVSNAVHIRKQISQPMIGIGGAVPYEIESALTDAHLFVGSGNGIAEHLLAGRQAEGKPIA